MTRAFFTSKGGKPVLDRTRRPADEEAWVSIHTDDCDAYGTTTAILNDIHQIIHKQWKTKVVDSDFMLGVRREFKLCDNGVRTYKMSMPSYVEGAHASFKEGMTAHVPRTPFPHGMDLKKGDATDDEAWEVHERGYLELVGKLLWAARAVYPECLVGLHQLSKVASRPSEKAWKSGIHMLKWMYLHRYRGITFSSDGNSKPIVFSDASNKPDTDEDAHCQYGYCAMFKGGPIASLSKKLPHVGLSAYHNEFMALRYAASTAMWMRHIFPEIGCAHYVQQPTVIYGDNTAANQLTEKDFINTGNQHIYVPYFFIKELVNSDQVTVQYKPTKINLADLFTKPVPPQVAEALVHYLVGQDPNWQYHIETQDAPEFRVHAARAFSAFTRRVLVEYDNDYD